MSIPLLGAARLLEVLTQAATRAQANRTLIACQRGAHTTLRFAHGRIHQNFHSEMVEVWVKVVRDHHVGVSTTNAISPEALRRATDAALAMARVGGRRRGSGISDAPRGRLPAVTTYWPATVEPPLPDILYALRREWQQAARAGYDLAGSFTIGTEEFAVAGAHQLARYQPFTIAGTKMVATRDGASGYAAAATRDLSRLDLAAVAERAVHLAEANRRPRDLSVGRTDCLLEPEAVAELLEWLGFIAFGAKALAERTSCLTSRLGDRLMSEMVTISDDALHPDAMAVPFDYEGVPKQHVVLVDRGRAAGVVYDSDYGKLYNRPSTGHAMPYDDTEGPLPSHLTLAAGTAPRATMERLLGDGLTITRFHYVNGLLDTRQALMTGLTRDGTFLVKRGKVVGSVKNLRFTQSIVEAFSRVAELSRERRLVADPGTGFSSTLAPTMLVRGFTFTGKTA